MPTFKHPCPHCGKYVARDVATCPFCGVADPFAPARCPSCRTVIEDAAWAACPKCGTSLAKPAAAAQSNLAAAQSDPAASGTVPQPNPAAPGSPAPGKCSGCGAPLAAGARFCTVCGTLTG